MEILRVERKLDRLSRVTIPAEIMRLTGLHKGMKVVVSWDGKNIQVKRAGQYCRICGDTKDLIPLCNTTICPRCIAAIKNIK